jgi:hypothetical protein
MCITSAVRDSFQTLHFFTSYFEMFSLARPLWLEQLFWCGENLKINHYFVLSWNSSIIKSSASFEIFTFVVLFTVVLSMTKEVIWNHLSMMEYLRII